MWLLYNSANSISCVTIRDTQRDCVGRNNGANKPPSPEVAARVAKRDTRVSTAEVEERKDFKGREIKGTVIASTTERLVT